MSKVTQNAITAAENILEAVEHGEELTNADDLYLVAVNGFELLDYCLNPGDHFARVFKNGVMLLPGIEGNLPFVAYVAMSPDTKIIKKPEGFTEPEEGEWFGRHDFDGKARDAIESVIKDIFVDAARAILDEKRKAEEQKRKWEACLVKAQKRWEKHWQETHGG